MPASLKPQRINETAWYYEHQTNLCIVVECYDHSGTYHKTLEVRVPLAMIRKSLKRIARKGK